MLLLEQTFGSKPRIRFADKLRAWIERARDVAE
jgi:hypothetical protein